MEITRYQVIKPPTGGEVRDAAYQARRSGRKILRLSLMGQQQVPPPREIQVAMRLARIHDGPGGQITVSGNHQISGQCIFLQVGPDDAAPATVEWHVPGERPNHLPYRGLRVVPPLQDT